MRRVSKIALALIAVILILAVSAMPVFAQEIGKSFTVGKATVVVFAPSTVWQGTNANVSLKITNNGSEPISDFKAVLKLPEGQAKNITYTYKSGKDGVDEITLKNPLQPGKTAYLAFTSVVHKTSMPIGQYKASVEVSSGGQTQALPWSIDLREGTRFQASTGEIVLTILAVSLLTMIGWFAYFKKVVNPSFQFFSSAAEAVVGIGIVVVFIGLNAWPVLSPMLSGGAK